MITVGSILIILQGLALIGGAFSGRLPFSGGLISTLGYFLPAIIGTILITKGSKKNKK